MPTIDEDGRMKDEEYIMANAIERKAKSVDPLHISCPPFGLHLSLCLVTPMSKTIRPKLGCFDPGFLQPYSSHVAKSPALRCAL